MKKKMLFAFCLTLLCGILSTLPCVADLDLSLKEQADAVLTYDGIQGRLIGEDAGIRSCYTVNDTAVSALQNAGYRVYYGALMGIASYNGEVHNTYDGLTVRLTNGEILCENDRAAVVTVYAAGQTVGKYTMVDAARQVRKFAYTTLYSGTYASQAYYRDLTMVYRGFCVVADANGNALYTTYDSVEEGNTVWQADGVTGRVSVYTVADYFTTHSVEEPIRYNKLLHTVLRVCKDAEMTGTCHCVVDNGFQELATVTNARAGIYAFSYKGEMTYGSGWNRNLRIRNDSIGKVEYSSNVAPSAEVAANGNDWKENVMYVYLQDGTNLLQIKATGGGTVTEWRLTLLEGTEVRAESDISLPYAADTATSTVLNAPANTGLAWTIVNYSQNGKIRHKVTARESGAYDIYAVGSMPGVTMTIDTYVGDRKVSTSAESSVRKAGTTETVIYTGSPTVANTACRYLGTIFLSAGENAIDVTSSDKAQYSSLIFRRSDNRYLIGFEGENGYTYAVTDVAGKVVLPEGISVNTRKGTAVFLHDGKEFDAHAVYTEDTLFSLTYRPYTQEYTFGVEDMVLTGSGAQITSDGRSVYLPGTTSKINSWSQIPPNQVSVTVNTDVAGIYRVCFQHAGLDVVVGATHYGNSFVVKSSAWNAVPVVNQYPVAAGTPDGDIYRVPDDILLSDEATTQETCVYLAAGENTLSVYPCENAYVCVSKIFLTLEQPMYDDSLLIYGSATSSGGAVNYGDLLSGTMRTGCSFGYGGFCMNDGVFAYKALTLTKGYYDIGFLMGVMSNQQMSFSLSYTHDGVEVPVFSDTVSASYYNKSSRYEKILPCGRLLIPEDGEYIFTYTVSNAGSVNNYGLYLSPTGDIPCNVRFRYGQMEESVIVKNGDAITLPEVFFRGDDYTIILKDEAGNAVDLSKGVQADTVIIVDYELNMRTEYMVDASELTPFGEAKRTSDGKSVYLPGLNISNGTDIPASGLTFTIHAEAEGVYRLSFRIATPTGQEMQLVSQNITQDTSAVTRLGDWNASRTMMNYKTGGSVTDGSIFGVADTQGYSEGTMIQYLYQGENTIRLYARSNACAIREVTVTLSQYTGMDGSAFLFDRTGSRSTGSYSQFTMLTSQWYPLSDSHITYNEITMASGFYTVYYLIGTDGVGSAMTTDVTLSYLTQNGGDSVVHSLGKTSDLSVVTKGGYKAFGIAEGGKVYIPENGNYTFDVGFDNMKNGSFIAFCGFLLIPTFEPVTEITFISGLSGNNVQMVPTVSGETILPPDVSIYGYTYEWQDENGDTVTVFPTASVKTTYRAVYTEKAKYNVTLHYGNGNIVSLANTYCGEDPLGLSLYEVGYYDNVNGVAGGVYRAFDAWTDVNGNEIAFAMLESDTEVYARFTDYSVINLEKNPLNTDAYKVAYVSDLHYGMGAGTWKTTTEHRFFSGKNLRFTAGRIITLPAGISVTFRGGSAVKINGGATTTEYAQETTVYLDTETQYEFTTASYITVPDGTTMTWNNGCGKFEIALLFTDALLQEYAIEHYDAVVCIGDMTSDEENPKEVRGTEVDYASGDVHIEDKYLWQLVNLYMKERMDGIPYYFVYANHDNCTDEEWGMIFDYSKDYILNIGTVVDNEFRKEGTVVAVDTFAGYDSRVNPFTGKLNGWYQTHMTIESLANKNYGYGWESDIKPTFLACLEAMITDLTPTTVAAHYVDNSRPLLAQWIAANDAVFATVMGHSHAIAAHNIGGKPGIEEGNFSFGEYQKQISSEMTEENVLLSPNEQMGFWTVYYISGISSDTAIGYFVYPEMQYGYQYEKAVNPYQRRFSLRNYVEENPSSADAFDIRRYKEFTMARPISEPPATAITCWGDSLTAGSTTSPVGGYNNTLATLSGLPVYNFGIGGEQADWIAARAGAYQLYLKLSDNQIPSETVPVELTELKMSKDGISFSGVTLGIFQNQSDDGSGSGGVNLCSVAGVEGYLTRTVNANGSQYYFTRKTAGEAVTLPDTYTPLYTYGQMNRLNDITVIFVGTNGMTGGYGSNYTALISLIQAMIDNLDTERYLVVGMMNYANSSTGRMELSSETAKTLETAMVNAFGKHYVNIRAYFTSEQALVDAALTFDDLRNNIATGQYNEASVPDIDGDGLISDFDRFKAGVVPHIFKLDENAKGYGYLHMNDLGYQMLGTLLYQKMVAFDYFN